jgi:hypothetical protein
MWRRLLVLTGLAALVAYFLRRRSLAPAPIEADPAEELRRKLDETRGRTDDGQDAAPGVGADLDARRGDVHDRARAAADEMRRSTSD